MMSSLLRGLCLAALIMVADVMAQGSGGDDVLSQFETDNPYAPLADHSEEGADAIVSADKEGFENRVSPTYKDYPSPLFTDEHYDAGAEAGKNEMERDAENELEYLHDEGHFELPEGVSLPKGKAAHKAASMLHEDLQHASHNAVLHRNAKPHPGQQETQEHHKANIAALAKEHGVKHLHDHLKGQGAGAKRGSAQPHQEHDQHHAAGSPPHSPNPLKPLKSSKSLKSPAAGAGHDQHHAHNDHPKSLKKTDPGHH